MGGQSLKVIIFVLISYIFSVPAGAAIYNITFYEQISAGTNLFSNYQVSGSASFEVSDSAVRPNNLVLFTSPDFISFDAILNTTAGDARFTLGIDDFPPKGDGTLLNDKEQGIIFDASGQPLRFDTPATTAGNGAQICDPSCTAPLSIRTNMVLWDNNGFDKVFMTDGTITTLEFVTNNSLDYRRLGGDWTLRGALLTVGGRSEAFTWHAAS